MRIIAFIVMFLVGCSTQNSRPHVGDRVVPEVQISEDSWYADEAASFVVVLRVNAGEASMLLQTHEVPEEAVPIADVSFYSKDRLLEVRNQVPFERDC